MQPTSKSSSLFSKRSTSMVRASVFVDPQPTQADDPQSIFTTTSHQSNHESTNKQALAPIGVRRAFGEITNHRQQHQPDSIFQSMNKKPPLSNNNLNWNQPILPQNKPQQEEKPPALASSSCRFHEPKFDPFSTEIDSPFGVGQTTTTTAPFGQGKWYNMTGVVGWTLNCISSRHYYHSVAAACFASCMRLTSSSWHRCMWTYWNIAGRHSSDHDNCINNMIHVDLWSH